MDAVRRHGEIMLRQAAGLFSPANGNAIKYLFTKIDVLLFETQKSCNLVVNPRFALRGMGCQNQLNVMACAAAFKAASSKNVASNGGS
jgi:hypothetical protein